MNIPADGPLNPNYGPYVRGAQPIGKGFFLVDHQRGVKGKGKVWRPAIIRENPRYVPDSHDYRTCNAWQLVAEVNPQLGKYVVDGYVKATVWWDGPTDQKRRGIEGYFPDEAEGVQFIVRVAPDHVQ